MIFEPGEGEFHEAFLSDYLETESRKAETYFLLPRSGRRWPSRKRRSDEGLSA
jgi:hypothetical protein